MLLWKPHIYITGTGKKIDNIFNDGKEICKLFYNQLGENDFIKTVNEEWKNRQNEETDDNKLSYYLDILGW